MDARKPLKSEKELTEAFDELFSQIPSPQNMEEAKEYIRELGLDPELFGEKINDLVVNLLKTSEFDWKARSSKEIQVAREKLSSQHSTQKDLNREQMKSMINELLAKLSLERRGLSPVHYRNFEDLSENDMWSLLQDLKYVAGGTDTDNSRK